MYTCLAFLDVLLLVFRFLVAIVGVCGVEFDKLRLSVASSKSLFGWWYNMIPFSFFSLLHGTNKEHCNEIECRQLNFISYNAYKQRTSLLFHWLKGD